jgi:hypothetical protein
MLKESSYYTFLRINEKIKPRKNVKLTSPTNSKSTKAVPACTLRDPCLFKVSRLVMVYPFGSTPSK